MLAQRSTTCYVRNSEYTVQPGYESFTAHRRVVKDFRVRRLEINSERREVEGSRQRDGVS